MITLPEPEDIGSKLDNDQIINIGPDPKLIISIIRINIFKKLKFFILSVLVKGVLNLVSMDFTGIIE